MDTEETPKIIDLSKHSKYRPKDVDVEKLSESDELVNYGVEVFNEHIQDAEGFLAILINEEGTPAIVWAGDVDTISVLGSLKIAEQIFVDKTLYGTGEEDEILFNDE